jgi:hypothetical protein
MNLFELLPEDIQKLVSFYLTVVEIDKIPSNFTNANSTLWKEKAESLLDMKVNYKLLYLIAEKKIKSQKSILILKSTNNIYQKLNGKH